MTNGFRFSSLQRGLRSQKLTDCFDDFVREDILDGDERPVSLSIYMSLLCFWIGKSLHASCVILFCRRAPIARRDRNVVKPFQFGSFLEFSFCTWSVSILSRPFPPSSRLTLTFLSITLTSLSLHLKERQVRFLKSPCISCGHSLEDGVWFRRPRELFVRSVCSE